MRPNIEVGGTSLGRVVVAVCDGGGGWRYMRTCVCERVDEAGKHTKVTHKHASVPAMRKHVGMCKRERINQIGSHT